MGFPKQLSGRRPKLPQQPWQPAPSLARAPLFWRWGLARRASRNILALGSGRTKRGDLGRRRGRRGFKSMSQQGQPMAVLSTMAEDPASGRNGTFYPSEAAIWPDLLDFGCGWPISHCPAQAVYQRPGRPGRVVYHFSRREESSKVWAWVWPVGLPESSFPSF